MNCPNPNCKATGLPDDARFCPDCGCNIKEYRQHKAAEKKKAAKQEAAKRQKQRFIEYQKQLVQEKGDKRDLLFGILYTILVLGFVISLICKIIFNIEISKSLELGFLGFFIIIGSIDILSRKK